MQAICRRELQAYFKSPLGYIYLAIFFFFGGQFLADQISYYGTNQISTIFSSMFSILLFTMPILTMRLMSEDKRLKTDQALLTAPVSLEGIVMGKFLAALALFGIAVSMTIVDFIVLSALSSPQWSIFFSNLIGIILLGAALISIGLFISCMTESQMVAAIVGFAAMFAILMIDNLASALPTALSFVATILTKLSFMTPYNDFVSGILDLGNVLFFVSVTAVFLFLTVRILEKKRWS